MHKTSLWMYDSIARLNFLWEWNTLFCFNILVPALQYSRLEIIKQVLLVFSIYLIFQTYLFGEKKKKKTQTAWIFQKVGWGIAIRSSTKNIICYFPLIYFIISIIWKEKVFLFVVINQLNLKPSLCFMFSYTLVSVLIGINHRNSNGLFFLYIVIEKYWLMVFNKSFTIRSFILFTEH